METKYRGSGWIARLDEKAGGSLGIVVSRMGGLDSADALRVEVREDPLTMQDQLGGKMYQLVEGGRVVGRWSKRSNVLVIDLRAFASVRRERGHGSLSHHEYHGEVTLFAD